MAILTHGGDMTLAPTLTPIVQQTDGTVRAAVGQVARLGFPAAQLDAALAGLRPRDLSERARKDLVALFGRAGVRLAGLDLFIPRRHFTDTAHVDRAAAAALAAIGLAADLGRVPLSLALPVADAADDLKQALVEAADGHGVTLAVHGEDDPAALLEWISGVDLPALGAALDPAIVIAQGGDPAALVNRLGRHLRSARLSDQNRGEAGRCPVGEGELDVSGYRIALDLAAGRTGPVVLDLRGSSNAVAAAETARSRWDDAAFAV